MTSHELGRKLLEGPDLPVVLRDEENAEWYAADTVSVDHVNEYLVVVEHASWNKEESREGQVVCLY